MRSTYLSPGTARFRLDDSGPLTAWTTRSALLLTIAYAGWVDIPGRLGLGASLTVVTLLALISAVLLSTSQRQSDYTWLYFVGVSLWFAVSAVLNGLSVAGLQTALVLAAFGYALLLSQKAAGESHQTFHFVRRWLIRAGWVSSTLYAASIIIDGPGSQLILGSRSFALTAVVVVPVVLVRFYSERTWQHLLLPSVMTSLTFLSLSRTGALLVALAWLLPGGKYRPSALRFCLNFLVVGLLGGIATIRVLPSFADRFTGGDAAAKVAGIDFNTSGRATLWDIAWRGVTEHPWLGQGAGSLSSKLESLFDITYPHNELLRFAYDVGVPVTAVFVIAMSLIMFRLIAMCRKMHRPDTFASFSASEVAVGDGARNAFGLTLLCALTDNPFSYMFVFPVLAVLAGCALSITDGPDTNRDSRRRA